MTVMYCNENLIIFDLGRAMEFDYIVVDLRRVKGDFNSGLLFRLL